MLPVHSLPSEADDLFMPFRSTTSGDCRFPATLKHYNTDVCVCENKYTQSEMIIQAMRTTTN